MGVCVLLVLLLATKIYCIIKKYQEQDDAEATVSQGPSDSNEKYDEPSHQDFSGKDDHFSANSSALHLDDIEVDDVEEESDQASQQDVEGSRSISASASQ